MNKMVKNHKILLIVFSVLFIFATALGFLFVNDGGSAQAQTEILGWQSYHGDTSVSYADGAMKLKSTTNPGSVFFADRKFENYEMEVEMKLNSGSWFGLMYRGNGDQKGFYQLGAGTGGYHQLKRHVTKSSGSGWDEVNIIKAQTGWSPYALGETVKLKVRLQDNLLTLSSMQSGDSDYFVEFDGVAIPSEVGTGEGYVGFCLQYSDVTVYSVRITDLDSSYTYESDFDERSKPQAEWSVVRGTVTPTYSDGVYTLAPSANPTVYGINNIDFKNYVLETEYSYNAQWAGVVFRVNGAHKGFYMTGNGSTNIQYHITNSGNGWNSTKLNPTGEGYTNYSLNSRIRVKLTVSGNKLTAQQMIVGTDADYVTTFENADISEMFDGVFGTSGGVGLVTRTGATMKVYDFTVTDTDTGETYYLPRLSDGEWAVTRGAVTPVKEDGVLTLAPTANPTSYVLTGVNFRNYVLEAEFSFTAQWAGIVFRASNTYKGLFLIKSGTTEGRYLNQHRTLSTTADGWGGDKRVTENDGYTKYEYNDRIKVRLTLDEGKLTAESMIVGKDTEWHVDFENFDIYQINEGVLEANGEVGLMARTSSTMSVYAFKVTDTDSGFTHDLFAPTSAPIEESVSFDGNRAIDTEGMLTEVPDTTEVYFKTEEGKQQTILSNYRRNADVNGFYLNALADGRLRYFENNGDGYSNINVTTEASFSDGEWHKAVVRRYYDAARGLFKVELSVYTDGVLVDKAAQTFEISAEKKAFYEESGNKFIIPTRHMQIGTYNEVEDLFVGEIAEIRMWDYALTEEELSAPRTLLDGTEEGLLHCFVPENGVNFVDLVTSQGENEIVADSYEVWMSDYVLEEADFRIAVLPDVQFLTEGFEINMRNYFTWIKENAEALNIKLVLSVGDLVNTCTPEQMHIVTEAASILDGTVPYMPVMGNHDYPTYGRDAGLFNEYYPYEKYSRYDYFGGAYEEGSMENYYYLMDINGVEYMFMGLELAVRPAVAQWANEVIAAHPNHKVVIVNHAYMEDGLGNIMAPGDPGCASSYKTDDGMDATELYDTLISKHDNIVLVICGHMNSHRAWHRTDVNENGHTVNSILLDFSQEERHFGAVGMVGLLGFTDGDNTVHVNAYSTVKDQYFITNNQYDIELDWQEEYRVTFTDASGIVYDKALKAGETVVLPETPQTYSDGEFTYTFTAWEGYTEGMTVTQNCSFTATYEKTETTSVTALESTQVEQNVLSAKTALFGGNANAYVCVAQNAAGVQSVAAGGTMYGAEDKLNVFGGTVPAYYVEDGALYVHVLALGTEDSITAFAEQPVVLSVQAFGEGGKAEVTTPSDLNRSRYDYMLEKYVVTVYGEDEIAFTTAAEQGESVLVCVDGEYTLVQVEEALFRNVAKTSVLGENATKEYFLIEEETIFCTTVEVIALEQTAIDGDLSDWNEEILQTGRTLVGLGDTSHKRVTYYAYLAQDGLYFAAEAFHELYVNSSNEWFNNTNLEVCISGADADDVLNFQIWISANANTMRPDVDGTIKTVMTDEGYHSIAEGFIAMENLPLNALTGELNIGFAWKTPNDKINFHNMTSGGDWWYSSRRHAHQLAELYFVNSAGIWDYSTVRTVNNIKLDGNYTDFNEEAQEHMLSVWSTDESVGYDLRAQYVQGSGVYAWIQATHTTNPRPTDNYSWYNNTNFEFYIGANRYWVTICGTAVGNGLYGRNVYLAQDYDETSGKYTTTVELFIPDSALGTVTYVDYVRMGFAFKPTGELAAFNGFSATSDFWYLAGHEPSNTETQFYIYAEGISTTAAQQVGTPATCIEPIRYQLTATDGGSFIIERPQVDPQDGHKYGEAVTVVPPTCTEEGNGYKECEYCHKTVDASIPASGHEYGTWIEEIPATCEGTGTKGHYHCEACDTNFDAEHEEIADLTIPASGHEYGTWIEEIPATCEGTGTKGHYHCEACDTNFDAEHEEIADLTIPASGHEYGTWIEEIPATCEGTGTKGHYHCEACDTNFDAEHEEIADLTIPASGHEYGAWIEEIPATCEGTGTKGHYHCEACDTNFDAEYEVITDLTIEQLPPSENPPTDEPPVNDPIEGEDGGCRSQISSGVLFAAMLAIVPILLFVRKKAK